MREFHIYFLGSAATVPGCSGPAESIKLYHRWRRRRGGAEFGGSGSDRVRPVQAGFALTPTLSEMREGRRVSRVGARSRGPRNRKGDSEALRQAPTPVGRWGSSKPLFRLRFAGSQGWLDECAGSTRIPEH